MTKYSLLEMKKRNYGRILLVASLAGKEVSIHTVAAATDNDSLIWYLFICKYIN